MGTYLSSLINVSAFLFSRGCLLNFPQKTRRLHSDTDLQAGVSSESKEELGLYMYGSVLSKIQEKLLDFLKTLHNLIQTSVAGNVPRTLKNTEEFFKTFSDTFLIPPANRFLECFD